MSFIFIILGFCLVYVLAKADYKRDKKKGIHHDWKYYSKKGGMGPVD